MFNISVKLPEIYAYRTKIVDKTAVTIYFSMVAAVLNSFDKIEGGQK